MWPNRASETSLFDSFRYWGLFREIVEMLVGDGLGIPDVQGDSQ